MMLCDDVDWATRAKRRRYERRVKEAIARIARGVVKMLLEDGLKSGPQTNQRKRPKEKDRFARQWEEAMKTTYPTTRQQVDQVGEVGR